MTLAAAFEYQEMLRLWQPLLGLVTLYEGNVQEAHRLLNESLRLCVEQNDKPLQGRIHTHLAEAALCEGKLGQAEQSLRESLANDAAARSPSFYDLERLWIAARLATAQGHYRACRHALWAGRTDAWAYSQCDLGDHCARLADTALVTVHVALDPVIFAEAFAIGQKLSFAEAFAAILAREPSRAYLTR